ncbi:protein ANKUB1-like [Anguilla anguilla]|uniref:protein ANKUB1-like n=1 Tax=Anguilla anguilla TaxID=7936 RepID=UPI0015AEDF2D|nr:protein ANKUB1-like [Anguilla anguilla]XP_035271941.1 protein ANKUB1-like [Anguilla anguilla]XP_035271943.1 protein ANKUB1-like [Anguilla anguilla]XP_035271944.1 protein ANKUB1-like [Anguilla anguilla]
MRIFIAFEGSCEPFDISQHHTVKTIKQMIKEFFHVQLSDDRRTRRYLELSYAGASLQDGWSLPDIGIAPCSTIRCLLKEEDKPVLHVFSPVTGETLSLMGTVFLLTASGSALRSLVSRRSGLPVGAFRLSTPGGLELYDCTRLDEYGVEVGATLRLDTWDGWTELLRGALLGHKRTVQRYLSEEEPVMRFQQRVALYVAAFFGHLDLASWLLRKGVRAEEPVGVHPHRMWCRDTDHPETGKCPVHAAVEAGQLHILKSFVGSSVLNLSCRDPAGLTPLRMALRGGRRDCVRYLVAKLWSAVSFPGLALTMGVYIQVKRWACRAQRRACRWSQSQSQRQRAPSRARVGDTVLVDGFTVPEMTSKPWSKAARAGAGARLRGRLLPALMAVRDPNRRCSQPPPGPATQNAPGRLPRLRPDAPVGRGREGSGAGDGPGEAREVRSAEGRDQNRNTWRSKVPLPAVSRDTNPRPRFIYASPNSSLILSSSLDSFTKHSGRTTRENAIYCLALASAFTEKPWLHQLGMARTLAQRTVHKLL